MCIHAGPCSARLLVAVALASSHLAADALRLGQKDYEVVLKPSQEAHKVQEAIATAPSQIATEVHSLTDKAKELKRSTVGENNTVSEALESVVSVVDPRKTIGLVEGARKYFGIHPPGAEYVERTNSWVTGDESKWSKKGVTESDNLLMPKCFEMLRIEDLKNASWCDPKYAPNGRPPPKSLQGLYWMKWDDFNLGFGAMDVAACLSTSEWDPHRRVMRMQQFRQFVFKDTLKGTASAFMANPQNSDAHYDCEFKERYDEENPQPWKCNFNVKATGGIAKDITSVKKNLTGAGGYLQGMLEENEVNLGETLAHLATGYEMDRPMSLEEVPSGSDVFEKQLPWMAGKTTPPGEIFNRITYLRNETGKKKMLGGAGVGLWSHHYPWVRIMDGDMNVREETVKQMEEHINSRQKYETGFQRPWFVRYTNDCENHREERIKEAYEQHHANMQYVTYGLYSTTTNPPL